MRSILGHCPNFNATSLSPDAMYEIGTRTVDMAGNVNTTWVNGTAKTLPLSDTTPPASITDLKNISCAQTHINWTWTDPIDADFANVSIWIDDAFKDNVPKGVQFYNATGFAPDTEHTIATRTIDASNNINQTWVNHTARTALLPDITAPASITNLTYVNGTTWINWTWSNPTDADLNYTMIFLNGSWKANTSIQSYNATGLTPDTVYEIATRTTDKAGNINATWVNGTAKTLPVITVKLISITVTPVNPTISLGQTQQFIANGTYSDGSIKNITSITTCSSSNTSVATIDASGLASSIAPGVTQINATSDGITSPDQTLTVTSSAGSDYIRPAVEVIVTPQANIGESVTITVKATDNVGVISRSLTVNGIPVALDASWNATYSSPAVGVFTAIGTALDAAGNEGQDKKEFRVLSPG